VYHTVKYLRIAKKTLGEENVCREGIRERQGKNKKGGAEAPPFSIYS
jgi:hypothetical protein